MTSSRTSARRRTAVAGSGLALTVALLAGCSNDIPQPDPEKTAEAAPPVLDSDRLERILGEIGETVTAADSSQDAEALKPRVTGPALELRAAEYRLAQATDGEFTPEPLTTASQVNAVAATRDFPRTAVVITEVPEGGNLPLLIALQQAEARDQFKLWGWVRLFPGIQTPALTHPDTGSAPVVPENLVATPAEVVERYVAVLNDPEHEAAAQFSEDPYRTSSHESTAELDEAVEAAGDASFSAEAAGTDPLAVSTADGGALVLAPLRSTLTLTKTVPGSELRAGGAIGALLGDDTEVRGSVSGVSDVLVAFYVPPAGADETTIQVLGATTVLDEVTRDDSSAPQE